MKQCLVSSPKEVTLAIEESKSMLSMALPLSLTGLLLYSRSLISLLFLGRLGPPALAAGSLAIAVSNITGYSLLSGLSMGMEPLCGQAFGAHRPALAAHALHRSALLLLLATAPLALLWASMHPLLALSGQNPDVIAGAHAYILCSIPDLLLHSLIHPLRIFLRSQSITLPLACSAAAAGALHIFFNYFLVSLLGLGIRGVALAALCTNFVFLLLLVGYVYFSGVHAASGGALRPTVESFREWRPLLVLAVPSCVSVCLEWWWYEVMILLCGLLADPESAVASMGILMQTTSFIYIFPSSLSYGVSTRVSNELGANRPEGARRAALVGVALGELLGLLAMCLLAGVGEAWPRVFTREGTIVAMTAGVLPVVGLCEVGNCPQTAGCGVLRGCARPRVGVNINLGAFYGVGMPAAVGLTFWWGMDFRGLWMGLLAAQGTCVVVMMAVIRRTDWSEQARRAQRLTGGAVDGGDGAIGVRVDGGEEETKCGDQLLRSLIN